MLSNFQRIAEIIVQLEKSDAYVSESLAFVLIIENKSSEGWL